MVFQLCIVDGPQKSSARTLITLHQYVSIWNRYETLGTSAHHGKAGRVRPGPPSDLDAAIPLPHGRKAFLKRAR